MADDPNILDGSVGGAGDASAANQTAQIDLLTTIDGDTGSLAALPQARSAAVTAGQTGIMLYGVRDDALSVAAEAEDEASPLRIDASGRAWFVDGGAGDAAVDSVQSMAIAGYASFVHKNKRYTAAATGDAIWTPAATKIFVCTYSEITWFGATDGLIVVWADASSTSDTAFTTATDRVLFEYNAKPSTAGPGGRVSNRIFVAPTSPAVIPLRVTSVGDIDFTVIVEGYEIVPA